MHVVQVLAALSLGGSELVATELAEFLRRNGHRVTVIAAGGPLAGRIRAAGASHLDWPVGKKRPATLALAPKLRHWLRDNRPDIIHVHSRFPALVVKLALQGLRPRPMLVSSMHGHYSVNAYSGIMARADTVIAVSNSVRDYTLRQYPRVDAGRVVTIPGGVDHQAFARGHRPSPEWLDGVYASFPELRDKRWLVLPGRLTQWKGHRHLISLLDRLGPAADVHGIFIGPGRPGSSYYRKLQRQIEAAGLASRISFTGPRSDMADWYAAAAIVYNLSDRPEAFGRTVLEALAIGTPVLAWDRGGPAELLAELYPEGRVPAGDVDTLEQKTRALLERPVPAPRFDSHSLEESMQQTLGVYQRLLHDD